MREAILNIDPDGKRLLTEGVSDEDDNVNVENKRNEEKSQATSSSGGATVERRHRYNLGRLPTNEFLQFSWFSELFAAVFFKLFVYFLSKCLGLFVYTFLLFWEIDISA